MNIYIPMEIKVRELEGRSLLAFEAASRGHSVLIGGKEDTISLSQTDILKPGVVLDKSISKGKEDNLRNIKNYKHILTSQDEEHGLTNPQYADFATIRFTDETLALSDAIYCWGNLDTKNLNNIFSKHSNKFINTGSPRVDLWRKEFDLLFKSEDSKNYILIVSNFERALDVNRIWNVYSNWLKKDFFSHKWFQNFFKIAAFQTDLLGEFIKMTNELNNNIPNICIVIRPKPVEDINSWNVLLQTDKNKTIHVKKNDGITKWIRNAFVVIHNSCTSAFEAMASNIPVITYRPIISDYEKKIPNLLGKEAKNPDEVVQIIQDLIDNKLTINDFKRNIHILNERFSNLAGEFAFKKIVDHWETFDSPRLSESNDEFLKKRIDFYLKRNQNQWNLKNLKNQVIKNLKIIKRKFIPQTPRPLQTQPDSTVFLRAHKFPSLELHEMQQLRDDYSKLFPEFAKVNIYQIGRRAYLLSKKGY